MDKAKEHNRLDKMIARTKELQKEIDHRHEVEEKVFELFSEGKFEEGDALLATLDDDRARELMEECPDEEIKEVRTMDKRVKLEEKAVMDIMKILTQGGISVKQSKSILDRVNVIFMGSSKNFLDDCDAKEVLETSSRYDVFKV